MDNFENNSDNIIYKRFWYFWKRYGEPITAISILIMLVFLFIQLKEDNTLKKEININCGWGEDDYQCYCEKSKAMVIKNKLEFGDNDFLNLSIIENVTMVK